MDSTDFWMSHAEMKYIVAALYTDFATHIVDDSGVEQVDAYTAGPRGQLVVRLEAVND